MAIPTSPPSPGSSAQGRGHLIVKAHRPLPRFICAVPVPSSSTTVDVLRNTIVAIVSGKVSADDDSKDAARKTNGKADESLSYSEYLKQQTVHEWRCKSIMLELRQNAMIAPETRDESSTSNGHLDGPGAGFELTDEHDCSLLEHGDEINVWLREGQTIESLRLPRLASRHKFGLPNQPSISRSGMLLDSAQTSPHVGSSDDAEYRFESMAARIRKPAEPSSHSSSVQGNPEGQFETTLRHRAGAQTQRVLTLGDQGYIKGAGGQGIYRTAATQDTSRPPVRSKPRRQMSEGSKLQADGGINGGVGAPNATRPVKRTTRAQSSGVLSGVQRSADATSSQAQVTPSQAPTTSAPVSNRDIINAMRSQTSQAPPRSERPKTEKSQVAGQRGMPAQALVVGPGVQGKVGRMNSMPAVPAAESPAASSPAERNGDYGMPGAFVAFTAAGTDMPHVRRPSGTARRMSSRSGMSDKQSGAGERLDRIRRPSENRGPGLSSRPSFSNGMRSPTGGTTTSVPKSKPPSKQYVKLPERPELPPVRNLNPFEMADERKEMLPPMPAPEKPPSISHMPDLEQDAAIARALSEALNFESPPSSPTLPTAPVPQSQAQPISAIRPAMFKSSTNGYKMANDSRAPSSGDSSAQYGSAAGSPMHSFADVPAQHATAPHDISGEGQGAADLPASEATQDEEAAASSPPPPAPPVPKTKAERRYQEVQKMLEAERQRQMDAEQARRKKFEKAELEKRKLLDKLDEERRAKLEKVKWQMWEEVRNRQKDGE